MRLLIVIFALITATPTYAAPISHKSRVAICQTLSVSMSTIGDLRDNGYSTEEIKNIFYGYRERMGDGAYLLMIGFMNISFQYMKLQPDMPTDDLRKLILNKCLKNIN